MGAVRRRGHIRTRRRQVWRAPSKGTARLEKRMSGNNEKRGAGNDRRWAPWYIYVVLIVGANYVKQSFLEDAPVVVNVIVTVIVAATIFVLVTALYRSMFAGRRRRP